jgi:hypothetical protein
MSDLYLALALRTPAGARRHGDDRPNLAVLPASPERLEELAAYVGRQLDAAALPWEEPHEGPDQWVQYFRLDESLIPPADSRQAIDAPPGALLRTDI